MKLSDLFKVSLVATAITLAGCGGDINLNVEETVEQPTSPTNPTPPTAEELPGTFSQSLSTEVSTALGRSVTVQVLSGVITQDTTLSTDAIWALDGAVFVGKDKAESATLTIDPGAVVFGNNGGDYIVVSRDSKIEASGTKNDPIIFTSKQDVLGETTAAGQWGGMVLLGNGISNKCPAEGDCALQVEGVESGAVFGGTDNTDSSGTLKYVVVKNAGFELSVGNELNGITFGAVGSGTTVDYLQVHNNADDGVEFFGGAVNLKHVVLTSIDDDSIDWDNGFQGKMQFVYVEQDKNSTDANRGIEADNDGKIPSKDPKSLPMISNLTIVGNNFNGEDDAEGIYLREGTGLHLYNSVITGSDEMGECLELEGIALADDGTALFSDSETVNNANDGTILMQNTFMSCTNGENFKDPKGADGSVLLALEGWFTAQSGNVINDKPMLGVNGQPIAGSPLLGAGQDVANTVDAFFDTVDFAGALNDSDDWREGWAFGYGGGIVTAPEAVAGCPTGTASISPGDGTTTTCEISGRITADLTLTAGNLYALDGAVFVGGDKTDSATLTIEPGVTVYGRNGKDYLVVGRDSKIEANGTKDKPISFTSSQDVAGEATAAGQWGGLVLLGNAPSNKCPDTGDCALQVEGVESGAVFGGTETTDNSGTLRYVRVMNGGYLLSPGNEINGITFGGVGSGTTVEYLQVHQNADDGIEFFGGNVQAKYVVLTSIQDDSIDWDNGFQGKLQHVLVKQAADNSDANRGIESDNDGKSPSKLPKSNPTIANLTIIGNTFDGEDDSEGMYFREGTGAQIYNTIVTGPVGMGECLEIEGIAKDDSGTPLFTESETVNNANDGTLLIKSSVIACSENFKDPSGVTFDTQNWWTTTLGNLVATGQPDVVNGIFTIDTTVPTDVKAIDSFFDTTDHIGAVSSTNDWTAGWTVGLE
ncbi:hypothetical protein [Pseudoalteromonas fuliginea]|uniref:Lipoprotein n=1 Tax=Pseudoalteromonas fuliginea TaxID=1872678 RepID=A0ABQ6REA8_9GAMM|nr:hypothetical protein [Pseudoalteromonas fuliginea]KAA1151024.1 hypothetical protein EU509_18155 [Pseudoalteromonas fuliginea]KAA1165698.1 hypothetical protein EUZ79_18145 [Pseudoalteromonas fuliginea]